MKTIVAAPPPPAGLMLPLVVALIVCPLIVPVIVPTTVSGSAVADFVEKKSNAIKHRKDLETEAAGAPPEVGRA